MRTLFAAILLIGAVAGCDEKKVASPPRPKPTFGQGVIRGKVLFNGQPPARRMIRNEPCCEGAPRELADESVVVNEKKELANVIVYLADIPASDGSAQPQVVLDQKFCQYTPHVLAVQVGQQLKVTSSDPTIHNVHYNPQQNAAGNYGMTTPGASQTVSFKNPEFIDFRCDVHPWMNARVGVIQNPFFAVTKEDGSFEITKIPPGNYTLKAWHERFGDLSQTIAVTNANPTQANFKYDPEAVASSQ